MSSREAFEEWLGEGFPIKQDDTGDYTNQDVAWAWASWQAATERAANLVSAEGPVIGSAGVSVVVAKIREGNE